MALSNFLRWPNETPSFLRSSSVKSGRTEYSIWFSANVWAYWPRPCLPSQSAKSVVGLAIAETLTYDRSSLGGSLARDPLCGRLVSLSNLRRRITDKHPLDCEDIGIGRTDGNVRFWPKADIGYC